MIRFESLKGDILERVPAAISALQGSADVVFAYLFGGLARGKVRPLSDVDMAVYLAASADPVAAKISLFDQLTDALETTELDLVLLNSAPTSLAGRILTDRVVLVDKDPFVRHRYESLARRQYFDFRHIEDGFFARRFKDG